MIGKRGLALTQVGVCCNPECRAPLYRELMADFDAEACFECDPEQFRDGWHPLLVELFEQSGGRLPPWSPPGEPWFDDRDAPGPVVRRGVCTEACCAGSYKTPRNHNERL